MPRILVVDEDDDVRELLAVALDLQGREIDSVTGAGWHADWLGTTDAPVVTKPFDINGLREDGAAGARRVKQPKSREGERGWEPKGKS